LVKQEDTMHLLSPVFAFIAIQLIARSLDFTLHNNTLIHTKWTGDEENIVEHKQHLSSWLRLARSSSFKISICTATLYFIRDICKARRKLKSDKLVLLYLCAILLSQSYAPEPNPEHLNIHVVYAAKQLRGRCRPYVVIPAMFGIASNVWVCTASYTKACTTSHGIATYVNYQIFHQVYLIQLVLKPQTDLTSLMTLQLVKAVLEAQTAASSPLDKTPKRSKVKRYDKPLRVVIINCQSVRNKKQELENLVESSIQISLLGMIPG
jgi:hypothetical protein